MLSNAQKSAQTSAPNPASDSAASRRVMWMQGFELRGTSELTEGASLSARLIVIERLKCRWLSTAVRSTQEVRTHYLN
jgi:hypothetical protein